MVMVKEMLCLLFSYWEQELPNKIAYWLKKSWLSTLGVGQLQFVIGESLGRRMINFCLEGNICFDCRIGDEDMLNTVVMVPNHTRQCPYLYSQKSSYLLFAELDTPREVIDRLFSSYEVIRMLFGHNTPIKFPMFKEP